MMTLEKLKTKYRQFKAWQKQPYQVAPMSHESHQCATCGTRFEGNYCPRCGQSASVGIYSFKKAFLLFLDVWGLGNRGMFRTIRDLLLRPGYMIRDYLQGMQMAYFPPFKMFFLLIALSLLVSSGFNIKGENRLEQSQELIMSGFDDAIGEPDNDSAAEASKQYSNQAYEWTMKHISLVTMVFLLLFSGTRLSVHQLFWIFRGSSLFDEYAPVVFRHIQFLLSEYLSRNVLLSVVSHPHQAVVGLQLSEHSAKIHSGIVHLFLRPTHRHFRICLCCKHGLFPVH